MPVPSRVDMPYRPDGSAAAPDRSVTIDAVRVLTQGGPVFHALWQSLAWIAGILRVFMPLAIHEYRKV